MLMWIILGVLAAVVLGIIVIMSVLDRKKAKKVKFEKNELNKEIEESKYNIAKNIVALIKTNQKQLKDFVPSVGKIKMADIRNSAKKGIKEIEHSKAFKLASEDEENNEDLFLNFRSIKTLNSNLWATKAQKEISYFEKLLLKEEKAKTEIKVEDTKSKKKFLKRKGKNELTK